MPVVAQRDVAELQLRGHAHLNIAKPHDPGPQAALTAKRRVSREIRGMAPDDQGRPAPDAATPAHDYDGMGMAMTVVMAVGIGRNHEIFIL